MVRLKKKSAGVKAPSDRLETVVGERAGILDDICAGDEDLYNAMKYALFVDPSCQLSLLPAEEKLVGEAQQLQQAGNIVAARVNY